MIQCRTLSCGKTVGVARPGLTEDARNDVAQGRLQIYKARARTEGREFNLPYAEFKRLLFSPCFYCGLPAEYGVVFGPTKKPSLRVACHGVDRVDNDRGYEPDNTVTACAVCNFAKSAFSLEAFAAWVAALKVTFPIQAEPDHELMSFRLRKQAMSSKQRRWVQRNG